MTLKSTKRLLFSLLFLAQLSLTYSVAARGEAFLSGLIAEGVVARAITATNNLLPRGSLRDGSPPAPLTHKERLHGVIPLEDAYRIVKSAADTALTEHCRLDWRKLSFRPLMRRERQHGNWSERQLTFIGIMHGYVQRTFREQLKTHPRCGIGHKQAIVEFFTQKHR